LVKVRSSVTPCVVNLSRQQVEDSPSVTTDQPVSRQWEADYFGYYGYSPYWTGPGLWGAGLYPYTAAAGLGAIPPVTPPARPTLEGERLAQEQEGDPHLRSAREVTGYAIAARDGDLGHVEDFLLDDATWALRYMVVDTVNWWPGKQVLVPPAWIAAISWDERMVAVDLTREAIKTGPAYDPAQAFDRVVEEALYRHYGRRPYWQEPNIDARTAAS
jgi:hypothetical protein